MSCFDRKSISWSTKVHFHWGIASMKLWKNSWQLLFFLNNHAMLFWKKWVKKTVLTSRQHVLKWPQQLPYALISFESQQSGPLGPSSTPLWVQAIPFRLCPWRGHTNSNAPLSICCKWNVCPVTDNPLQSLSSTALQPSPAKKHAALTHLLSERFDKSNDSLLYCSWFKLMYCCIIQMISEA